jgi:hypothetical protein
LTRYDGWFLVGTEAAILFVQSIPFNKLKENINIRRGSAFTFLNEKREGELFLFITLAFLGIIGWLAWGKIILGNPFYFTDSQYSSKAQQLAFLVRGELPAYHQLYQATIYYITTVLNSVGIINFCLGIIGLIYLIKDERIKYRLFLTILLFIPFVFNILTLFLGQSIIFIPHLTPVSFEWRLFNVRYGVMMVPTIALLVGYLFSKKNMFGKYLIISMIIINALLYPIGYAKILTLEDGTVGLSHASHPDAEKWFAHNYDSGLVLIDDYARTLSIIGANIPMQKVVYIGTRPYWQESLLSPQKIVKWVIMQKGDAVWKSLYEPIQAQKNLYTYFQKTYTSENILIFKRIDK